MKRLGSSESLSALISMCPNSTGVFGLKLNVFFFFSNFNISSNQDFSFSSFSKLFSESTDFLELIIQLM